jgi:hypothetical protein
MPVKKKVTQKTYKFRSVAGAEAFANCVLNNSRSMIPTVNLPEKTTVTVIHINSKQEWQYLAEILRIFQ